MNFKFNFKAPKFNPPRIASMGRRRDAEVFGVENEGLSVEARFDKGCWEVFRKFNNREVNRREGRIKPMHADFVLRHIPPSEGMMSYLLLNGNCSGIDLVMAIVAGLTRRWGPPTELVMSSLSMNQDTIDKLGTLPMPKSILISSYFLATNPNNIVGRFSRDGTLARARISLGLWRNHTKIILAHGPGYKIFIHGSANLRSAGDINTMAVHHDSRLWEMNHRWIKHLIRREPISKYLATGETNANGFFTFLDQDRVALADDESHREIEVTSHERPMKPHGRDRIF